MIVSNRKGSLIFFETIVIENLKRLFHRFPSLLDRVGEFVHVVGEHHDLEPLPFLPARLRDSPVLLAVPRHFILMSYVRKPVLSKGAGK
jgi:hypothetical protein